MLSMIYSAEMLSQSGNSCEDAIAITAGTYNVDGINGETFGSNC